MAKSSRSKRIMGKGEVTPTQIAFIVDRYLFDNRFSETRSIFRSEASSLLSNSPLRQVPNSLMTLDDMLNDYVNLKKQKVILDQERIRLDQEKIRVQNLLQGMQNVMSTYNASLAAPPPPPPAAAASTSQQRNYTQNAMSVSLPGNKRVEFGKFSTPLNTQSISGKRKGSDVSEGAPPVTRKPRVAAVHRNETNKIAEADKVAGDSSSQAPSGTLAMATTNELMTGHGSSVAKCLFSKADSSIPTNSTCIRTPQKHVSPGSDKSKSPQKEVTPTNCTIVTKERFTISPLKKITSYTVERSHLISSSSSPVKSDSKMSSKRDHVKGRLNFDASDTEMCLEAPATADLATTSPSASEPEVDLCDIDFSNMEFLSENFSLSELLVEFELGCEGSTNHCLETVSGSSPESGNVNLEPDQAILECTSTVTATDQGNDMSTQGGDAKTIAKPGTKCLQASSPAETCGQSEVPDH